MAGSPDICLTKLGKECTITVTVHITRRLRVRMLIAQWLFWFAGKVLGCGIEVERESS